MNPFAYKLSLVHRKLDDAIRSERSRRVPDSLKLLRLKRLRLAIKDRLQRLYATPRRGTA